MSAYVIRKDQMRQQVVTRIHPVNPDAKRSTFSLGDATGLARVGLHYAVLAPGDVSTELHTHRFADEFVFVLSGSAQLELDDERIELGPGDFAGLPARGPAHLLRNTGTVELVYLLGGDRPDFDICDYPRRGQRLYLYADGDQRAGDFVRRDDIRSR
jgi:uncharacterized cupin superfamily protein